MDATSARTMLEDLVQWQAAPVLLVAEVERLMARAPLSVDAAGVAPAAVGYVPTYTVAAIERQVGEGWLLKAGKVAGQYKVGVGAGKTFERQQQYEMCLGMARLYGAGLAGGSGGAAADAADGAATRLHSVAFATRNTAGYE